MRAILSSFGLGFWILWGASAGAQGTSEGVLSSAVHAVQLAVRSLEEAVSPGVWRVAIWGLQNRTGAEIYTTGLVDRMSLELVRSSKFVVVDVNGLMSRLDLSPDRTLSLGNLRKLRRRAKVEGLLYGKIVDTADQHVHAERDYYTTLVLRLVDTERAALLWAKKVQGKSRNLQDLMPSRYARDRYEDLAGNLATELRDTDRVPEEIHRVGLLGIWNDSEAEIDVERLQDEIVLALFRAGRFEIVDEGALVSAMGYEEWMNGQLTAKKTGVALRYGIDAFLVAFLPWNLNPADVDTEMVASVRLIEPRTGRVLFGGELSGRDRVGGAEEVVEAARAGTSEEDAALREMLRRYLRKDVSE